MTRRERPSVWVSKLDTDKLTEILKTKTGIDSIKAEQMAIVNTERGVATVCSEGVGWWSNDDGLYLTIGHEGWSEHVVYLNAEEIADAISDEFIYLDEFINTFGDRLETNFDLWYHQVMGHSQLPKDVFKALQNKLVATS